MSSESLRTCGQCSAACLLSFLCESVKLIQKSQRAAKKASQTYEIPFCNLIANFLYFHSAPSSIHATQTLFFSAKLLLCSVKMHHLDKWTASSVHNHQASGFRLDDKYYVYKPSLSQSPGVVSTFPHLPNYTCHNSLLIAPSATYDAKTGVYER